MAAQGDMLVVRIKVSKLYGSNERDHVRNTRRGTYVRPAAHFKVLDYRFEDKADVLGIHDIEYGEGWVDDIHYKRLLVYMSTVAGWEVE